MFITIYREEHTEVTDLYLQAARVSINDIDPEVQVRSIIINRKFSLK